MCQFFFGGGRGSINKSNLRELKKDFKEIEWSSKTIERFHNKENTENSLAKRTNPNSSRTKVKTLNQAHSMKSSGTLSKKKNNYA